MPGEGGWGSFVTSIELKGGGIDNESNDWNRYSYEPSIIRIINNVFRHCANEYFVIHGNDFWLSCSFLSIILSNCELLRAGVCRPSISALGVPSFVRCANVALMFKDNIKNYTFLTLRAVTPMLSPVSASKVPPCLLVQAVVWTPIPANHLLRTGHNI